jgi:hypothetical protein
VLKSGLLAVHLFHMFSQWFAGSRYSSCALSSPERTVPAFCRHACACSFMSLSLPYFDLPSGYSASSYSRWISSKLKRSSPTCIQALTDRRVRSSTTA